MKSGKYGTIFEPKELYSFVVKKDKDKDKFVGDMAVDIAKTNTDAVVLALGNVKAVTVDARLITEYNNVYYSQINNYDDIVNELEAHMKKYNVNVLVENLSIPEMINHEDDLVVLARNNDVVVVSIV